MKLGPVLIGIPGMELDAHSRRQLLHPLVGGVVLFTRNYSNPAQLKELTADIRSAREPRLLICIDQEGGRVQRLKEGFTDLPPLRSLGRLRAADPDKALDMAYRHGRVMATEMLACGIDMSFAPVLDLDRGSSVIGDRALSADPAAVAQLGKAYLAGMHDAGMKTTGKHFPGHGSVLADSHVSDVTDPRPLEDIEASDLAPFKALATELDALMIAHVVYPRIDDRPAGYSRVWLGDFLRGAMAYRGVVFSDDLGMHAAKTAGGLATRMHRCLDAGCELALVCRPEDVEELLGQVNESPPDASGVISRLYGKPSLSQRDLLAVEESGIREFRHWQSSLESMEPTA
jgi:beta-N-acetylhexosaminidase